MKHTPAHKIVGEPQTPTKGHMRTGARIQSIASAMLSGAIYGIGIGLVVFGLISLLSIDWMVGLRQQERDEMPPDGTILGRRQLPA